MNIYYVARRFGKVVVQRWVIDHLKMRWRPDERPFISQYHKEVNSRNKMGHRTGNGERIGGKVIFTLGNRFSELDFQRYSTLMKKVGFVWKGRSFPAMTAEKWDEARLSEELYVGFENLSNEEIEELHKLVLRKQTISNKHHQRKSIMAPFDYFVLNAYKVSKSHILDRDYLFEDELEDLKTSMSNPKEIDGKTLGQKGIYIGGGQYYSDQGNFLTIGGTRSGKGTNLIIPQLLSTEEFLGSTVIIDVKGENAAITAKHLKASGKDVHIIDPWNLQDQLGADHGIKNSAYNPLDILKFAGDNTPDECDMFAEMLIPYNPENKDEHFDSRARQLISAYWLNMVSDEKYSDDRTFSKLMSVLRLHETDGEENGLSS